MDKEKLISLIEQVLDELKSDDKKHSDLSEVTCEIVDISKLPVDLLVEATDWDDQRFSDTGYLCSVCDNKEYSFKVFENGRSSKTSGDIYSTRYSYIHILEQEPKVWEGGECPIPDGVKFRYLDFDGCWSIPLDNASQLYWGHELCGGDIIAYHILEQDFWLDSNGNKIKIEGEPNE